MLQKGFILIFLMTFSCATNTQKTGFTLKQKQTAQNKFALKNIAIIEKIHASGFFVEILHKKNNRKIELFIPSDGQEQIEFKSIIDTLELNNNPNNWSFYYTPFGTLLIDSINVNGEKKMYDNYNTIISLNELYSFKNYTTRNYKIRYVFVENTQFCLTEVSSKELNSYNSLSSIDDGSTNNPSIYIFDKDSGEIPLLLPASKFCE